MLTEDFIKKFWLILVIVFLVIKEASSQCATNKCTSCSDIEIVCENLKRVPPLDNINGWSNIERISLTKGSIISIPIGYFNLSNLKIIDLTYNKLTTFNMNSLAYATKLRTINLTGNPIACDSNIHWLKKWKNFYPPGNRVYGTCANSEQDINTYLSDKPGVLVDIKFSNSSFVFDGGCKEIILPLIVIGEFTSPLEYRAVIHGQTNQATFNVVTEYIEIKVDENISNVTILNSGEGNKEVNALLQIISKLPLSYETNVEIRLQNGPHGCTAAVPITTVTTQTPSSSKEASETLATNPTESAAPTFVFVAATRTDKRETKSSTGTTPSLDHTQVPEITQSQRPALNHVFSVPTSTQGTVTNGPEGAHSCTSAAPIKAVSTQTPSSSSHHSSQTLAKNPTENAGLTFVSDAATRADRRETTKSAGTTRSPDHTKAPWIIPSQGPTLKHASIALSVSKSSQRPTPTAKIGPEGTAELTQESLPSTTLKPVTFAEHTFISKILPTPEPTSFPELRKSSVATVASEKPLTGKSTTTLSFGSEDENDKVLVVIVPIVVTVIMTVFIIAIWYYWSKRSRDKIKSTTSMKNDVSDVSPNDSSTAL